jgi:hypothetical protein
MNSIKTVKDWANLVQQTYNTTGLKAEVTSWGSEIVVTILDKEMEKMVTQVFKVTDNPERYSSDIVSNHKRILDDTRNGLIEGLKNQAVKDKVVMKSVGVEKYTYWVGDYKLVSIDV